MIAFRVQGSNVAHLPFEDEVHPVRIVAHTDNEALFNDQHHQLTSHFLSPSFLLPCFLETSLPYTPRPALSVFFFFLPFPASHHPHPHEGSPPARCAHLYITSPLKKDAKDMRALIKPAASSGSPCFDHSEQSYGAVTKSLLQM